MKKPVVVGCLTVLFVVIAGGVFFRAALPFREQLRLYEAQSSAGVGEAFFLSEGALQGASIGFYVRDPSKATPTPQFISCIWSADGGGQNFYSATWSRDGSVIAINARDTPPEWMCAYDFRNHIPVFPPTGTSTVDTIQQLLDERGGMGVVALMKDDLHHNGHSISSQVRRQFRTARYGAK